MTIDHAMLGTVNGHSKTMRPAVFFFHKVVSEFRFFEGNMWKEELRSQFACLYFLVTSEGLRV